MHAILWCVLRAMPHGRCRGVLPGTLAAAESPNIYAVPPCSVMRTACSISIYSSLSSPLLNQLRRCHALHVGLDPEKMRAAVHIQSMHHHRSTGLI